MNDLILKPVFDGISTAVVNYKLVEWNGNVVYVGTYEDCINFKNKNQWK